MQVRATSLSRMPAEVMTINLDLATTCYLLCEVGSCIVVMVITGLVMAYCLGMLCWEWPRRSYLD